VLAAVHITVQAENCALKLGAADVAPVEVIVTPDPAAKLVIPAPIDCTFTCSPAVKIDGGIVIVIAAAFDAVTNLLESEATKV